MSSTAFTLLVLATVAAMEGVAWAAHRYVMHGFGWQWHRSHHVPREGTFERNDLYAVVFAALAITMIGVGRFAEWPAFGAAGAGMTVYGAIYLLVHDGLVHRRLPVPFRPQGYLARLVKAHHLHHAVHDQKGCVSFGFIYAPPLAHLRRDLSRKRTSSVETDQRGRCQSSGGRTD